MTVLKMWAAARGNGPGYRFRHSQEPVALSRMVVRLACNAYVHLYGHLAIFGRVRRPTGEATEQHGRHQADVSAPLTTLTGSPTSYPGCSVWVMVRAVPSAMRTCTTYTVGECIGSVLAGAP